MRFLMLMVAMLLLGMTQACAGGDAQEEEAMSGVLETEELARGSQSSVAAESMLVLRDREAFATAWRQAGQRGDPPEVDFDQHMVLAIFMGERRTGGYSVHVDAVEATEEGLRVDVEMRAPGRDCMTTQALTRPFQLLRLPHVEGEVDFRISQTEVDC